MFNQKFLVPGPRLGPGKERINRFFGRLLSEDHLAGGLIDHGFHNITGFVIGYKIE